MCCNGGAHTHQARCRGVTGPAARNSHRRGAIQPPDGSRPAACLAAAAACVRQGAPRAPVPVQQPASSTASLGTRKTSLCALTVSAVGIAGACIPASCTKCSQPTPSCASCKQMRCSVRLRAASGRRRSSRKPPVSGRSSRGCSQVVGAPSVHPSACPSPPPQSIPGVAHAVRHAVAGADDMSAAGMTPREKGQHTIPHRLLREASMEMIKVRRQEHAKCEAILHRLDSEIAAVGFVPSPFQSLFASCQLRCLDMRAAMTDHSRRQDTEFLRRSLLSVSEKSKAQLLADLRGKVEISKRHKQRLRDLERDIADLNVTKRMGVAPFHTPESDRQPHLTPRLNTARSASSAQSTSASERRHLTARPPSAERGLHEKSHSAHGEVAGGYRL